MTTTGSDERDVLRQWGDDELGAGNGSVGQGLCEKVLSIIRRQPGVTRICDLGCGNGHLAWRLGQEGYTVTGIDASERLLSIAHANYGSDRVTFRQGLFGAAAVGDLAAAGPFDLAVSVDVVEHLYRPVSLIETADAILKPGGLFVVCTPYHGYLKNLAIAVLDRWDDHHGAHFDGGHIKFFSVDTLKALTRQAFEPRQMDFYGRFPGLWKNMICVARKRG
jgi:SAM-dependent methyltransferase